MGAAKRRISWFGQVKVYTGKCFRLFVNEKQWKNFITSFVLILIIVLVTNEKAFEDFLHTKNAMFTVVSGCIWVGLFNSIQSICRERAIIKREHRTGLKLSAYITAHAIYEVFLSAIEALIILIVVYVKYHDNIKGDGLIIGHFLDLYITFFLIVFSADTMAIFVSSLVRKENTAMTIMPFVLIIQLVMSGAIFELKKFAETISNITVSKWGMDATLRIANSYDKLHMSNLYYIHEQYPFLDYEAETGSVLQAWGIMILITAIFLIGSMLILRLVDKDKRI